MNDAPPPNPPAPQRMSAIVLGIADVARGRAAGLRHFGGTPQAVLAAMTPLLAFLLVGCLIAILGSERRSLLALAEVALALLGSLVVSYELASAWGRADRWPRFAVAYCWCQWAAPVAFAAMIVMVALLMALGVDGNAAEAIGMLALLAYAVWLQWFLARHALELSAIRAAVLVVVVSVAAAALMSAPDLASYWLNGPPPA